MDNVRTMRPRATRKPPPPNRRRIIIGIVVAFVVVLIAVSGRVLGFYVDWLWFGEVGFRSVFWTRFWWQLLVGVAGFAVFFVIVELNVELARRLAPSFRVTASGDLLEPRSEPVRKWVGLGGLGVSLLVAVIAGVGASAQWQTFLLYVKQAPFGEKDAIFGHDIGFYVFSLPVWQTLQSFVFGALVASLIFAAIMHLVMGGIDYKATTPGGAGQGAGHDAGGAGEAGAPASPFARAQRATAPQLPQIDVKLGGRAVAHLSGILAAIFVMVGVGQLFRAWRLLYSTAGAIYGAGYTDVHIRLPLTYVTLVIALLLAAALVWNIWRRHQWWPVVILVWVVAVIVLRDVVPAVYQSLIVNPNQLTKEREYIAHNLAATKSAYHLNDITQQNLSPKTPLTSQKLADNQPTLRNIRLWDPNTLVTSYRQLQELRPYYSFLDADVDRYTVGGVYRETMLSPRELNIDGLPAQAQTWVNQHITYTHGFGAAMSAVNQVTSDGSPDFLVQDIPPQSVKGLEITQPRIYYGERGTGYSLVKTKDKEFDYPGPNGDVYAAYQGSGGIAISPLLNRLAFSAQFGTIKFFTTSSIDGNSRVIIRNEIRTRISAAAPFLALDHDPYMVIADGRLYWIQDAYTTTSRYPYSTPQGDLNYLRNSVKIVVDAYNGTMKYYVFDEQDPLLKTYRAAYPSLFTAKSEMPQALLREDRGGRLQRHHEVLRVRRAGPAAQDLPRCLPVAVHRQERDAAGAARPHSVSRGPLRRAGRGVLHLPRRRRRRPLQQGRPVGDPRERLALGRRQDAGVLRDHAAPGRRQGGVPAHAAVRAQRPQQHDLLARRPLRRARLRQLHQLRVLQEHHRVRPQPGRGDDQPGSGHQLAAHALGPAGLAGDPRQPARDAD